MESTSDRIIGLFKTVGEGVKNVVDNSVLAEVAVDIAEPVVETAVDVAETIIP